eukprot:197988-Pyramimonas_sp.AAC.1
MSCPGLTGYSWPMAEAVLEKFWRAPAHAPGRAACVGRILTGLPGYCASAARQHQLMSLAVLVTMLLLLCAI